jgi:endonuclease/exonuclease/phosphatase (EEP) superfamily protein YafD
MGSLRTLGRYLFWFLVIVVVLSTLLPIIPSTRWYIRIWDYPRLQIFVLALLCLLIYFTTYFRMQQQKLLVVLALFGVVLYHGVKAFPYTPLAPKQVYQTERDPQDTTFVSLLIANVLQDNREHHRLLQMVEDYQPDVVVTLESDTIWEKALQPLETTFPYTVKVPLSNTYGMHLYSRLPLRQQEVMYLLEPDIPSIRAEVRLQSGEWIQLYVVHPRPPVPGESDDSKERDAEIVLIGKMAKKQQEGVVVAGDFNDVAWSPTTRLFQEVSGLLDPRIGRGFFNTFHANVPIFRWPLDHVFHSNHFRLQEMQRLPGIGSDHFPILIRLSYEPDEKAEQPRPLADEDTEEEAQEVIEKGREDATDSGQE